MMSSKARRFARAGDIDALIDLLTNGRRRERGAAATALGELGDPRAVQPLVDALLSSYSEDEDLAPIVTSSLGRFDDPRAVDALTELLAERRDDAFYFHAHREAIFALAERGAFEPLQAFSQDDTRDPDLRGEANALLRKHQRAG
jgi:HEAT repeat protein